MGKRHILKTLHCVLVSVNQGEQEPRGLRLMGIDMQSAEIMIGIWHRTVELGRRCVCVCVCVVKERRLNTSQDDAASTKTVLFDLLYSFYIHCRITAHISTSQTIIVHEPKVKTKVPHRHSCVLQTNVYFIKTAQLFELLSDLNRKVQS